jgi:predicted transcriptional regulator
MSFGPRLAVIPAAALADVAAGRLKAMDLRVLCALGSFTNRQGWARVKTESIAERVGPKTARETVSRSLSRLRELGWVESRAPKRGGSFAHAWRVNLNPDIDPEFDEAVEGAAEGDSHEPSCQVVKGGPISGGGGEERRDETVTARCDETVTAGVTTAVTAGVTTVVTPITKLNDVSNDTPLPPETGDAASRPASPPDGGGPSAARSESGASSGEYGAAGKRGSARREGGRSKRGANDAKRKFKPQGLKKRVESREIGPAPELPGYDAATAEGALVDAVLATPGRSSRDVAGWINPDGSFRFKIVRHPDLEMGVAGLYAVTCDMAGFRSAFTGALIHFGFRQGAVVHADFWARSRARLERDGRWRGDYERVSAEALRMGFSFEAREAKG